MIRLTMTSDTDRTNGFNAEFSEENIAEAMIVIANIIEDSGFKGLLEELARFRERALRN